MLKSFASVCFLAHAVSAWKVVRCVHWIAHFPLAGSYLSVQLTGSPHHFCTIFLGTCAGAAQIVGHVLRAGLHVLQQPGPLLRRGQRSQVLDGDGY